MAKKYTSNGLSVDSKILKYGAEITGDLEGKYFLSPEIDGKSLNHKLVKSNNIVLNGQFGNEDELKRVLIFARKYAVDKGKNLFLSNNDYDIENVQFKHAFRYDNIINGVKLGNNLVPMLFDEILKIHETTNSPITISANEYNSSSLEYYRADGQTDSICPYYNLTSITIPPNLKIILDNSESNIDIDKVNIYLEHQKDDKVCDLSNIKIIGNDLHNPASCYISFNYSANNCKIKMPERTNHVKEYNIELNNPKQLSLVKPEDIKDKKINVGISYISHLGSLFYYYNEKKNDDADLKGYLTSQTKYSEYNLDRLKELYNDGFEDLQHLKELKKHGLEGCVNFEFFDKLDEQTYNDTLRNIIHILEGENELSL